MQRASHEQDKRADPILRNRVSWITKNIQNIYVSLDFLWAITLVNSSFQLSVFRLLNDYSGFLA